MEKGILEEVKKLVVDTNCPVESRVIAEKICNGARITSEEGLWLYEHGELGWLGMLAELIRHQLHGNHVYFIRNFHIEPTNICINKCRFCSFSHHFSQTHWELTVDEILEKVCEQPEDMQEIHITGAVHPDRDLYYYGDILKQIREIRPGLHMKAYSAVEMDHMIRQAGLTIEDGLKYLKECGLGSIPGGGAEIFDETIRSDIAGMKSSSEMWLEIHEKAHRLGISSNATMLYGHLETYTHRIDHMDRLRHLQDKTKGFNAFIPLKFKNWNNEMAQLPELPVVEDMRNYAVARIYLDNIPHLKAYWPAIGKKNAQLTLSFGVDDMDGTINDSTKIYSLAGAEEQSPRFTVSEMQEFIHQVKRIPVERDSRYNPL
ncbi:MAG: CofH family radical SAM protein [Bacteroidales bacterium]|nr:CofH family radical SAM protein [Bacteroidota bacterium]MBL6950115.1 CofH family radical SAM protein [Bacteroidales bacterium]